MLRILDGFRLRISFVILSASQHLKFVKHQAEAVLEVGTWVGFLNFSCKDADYVRIIPELTLSYFLHDSWICTDQKWYRFFYNHLNWVMKEWVYRAKPRKHESSQPSSGCWIQMTFGCKQIAIDVRIDDSDTSVRKENQLKQKKKEEEAKEKAVRRVSVPS